jgi:hypothetical protein
MGGRPRGSQRDGQRHNERGPRRNVSRPQARGAWGSFFASISHAFPLVLEKNKENTEKTTKTQDVLVHIALVALRFM